jgi:hypothetical protein
MSCWKTCQQKKLSHHINLKVETAILHPGFDWQGRARGACFVHRHATDHDMTRQERHLMPYQLKQAALTVTIAAMLAAGGTGIIVPSSIAKAQAQGNSGDRAARPGNNRGEARPANRGPGNADRAAPGNRGNGNQGRGALASELRGLNAAHANPQAMANASPNSMPGRLATFRAEYLAVADASDALRRAERALAIYPEFQTEFTPGTQEYDDALLAWEAERAILEAAVIAAETDLILLGSSYNASYSALTGGTQLSPAAEAELLRLLQLR